MKNKKKKLKRYLAKKCKIKPKKSKNKSSTKFRYSLVNNKFIPKI